MDQKLVLRLQQLCQLEALLNLALNYAPSTLQLPTCQGGLVSLPAVASGPKVGHPWHANGHVVTIANYDGTCPKYVFEQGKKKAGGKRAQSESEMQVDEQAGSEEQSANQKENTPSNTHGSADVPVERQEDRYNPLPELQSFCSFNLDSSCRFRIRLLT